MTTPNLEERVRAWADLLMKAKVSSAPKCSVCGHDKVGVDQLVTLPVAVAPGVRSAPTVAFATLMCFRCGHTIFVNAGTPGLDGLGE